MEFKISSNVYSQVIYNKIFFLIDQDKEILEEIHKIYMDSLQTNNDEHSSDNLSIREYMIHQFRKFIYQDISQYSYETFLDQSIQTIDIYGLGTCFLYMLTTTYLYIKREFMIEMYVLIRRMIDTNIHTRIQIEELMMQYFEILDKYYDITKNLDLEEKL